MQRLRFARVATVALVALGMLAGSAGAQPSEATAREPLLSVGDAFNTDGPRRDGLFHGDREVSLDEFLRIGGMDERADQIRGRHTLRLGMAVAGAAAVVAGGVVSWTAEDCSHLVPRDLDFEDCYARHNRTQHIGIGIALVGVADLIWTSRMSTLKPSIHELRRLATDYNRPRRTPLHVSPVVHGDGGGLAISGQF